MQKYEIWAAAEQERQDRNSAMESEDTEALK